MNFQGGSKVHRSSKGSSHGIKYVSFGFKKISLRFKGHLGFNFFYRYFIQFLAKFLKINYQNPKFLLS